MNNYNIEIKEDVAILLYKAKKAALDVFNNVVTNDCVLFHALSELDETINRFPNNFKNCFSMFYTDENEDGEEEEVEGLFIDDNIYWEHINSYNISIKKDTLELLNCIKFKLLNINREEYSDLDFDLMENKFVDNEIIRMALNNLVKINSKLSSYEEMANYPDKKFDEMIEKDYFGGKDLFAEIYMVYLTKNIQKSSDFDFSIEKALLEWKQHIADGGSGASYWRS